MRRSIVPDLSINGAVLEPGKRAMRPTTNVWHTMTGEMRVMMIESSFHVVSPKRGRILNQNPYRPKDIFGR
jgi:hypothetical protein